MRLTDLDPKLESRHLRFDCPLGHAHKIRVPVNTPNGWRMTGEFPDTLSLTPSILAHTAHPNDMGLMGEAYDAASVCGWHGFITNGEIITV